MINAAIVGLGRWGKNIVDAVQGKSKCLRFVRGMVRHPDAVRDFAARHQFELSADFADVLADTRVHAVVLATPHTLHTQQIIAAAGGGKAVFCEKPLALTRADAERAVAACQRAGVLLGVGHDKRFWASMQELKRVVASGELGEILHVEGNSSNEVSRKFFTAWRESAAESPGGGMTGTGIHIVDAFVNLIGPVRRVQAQFITRKPPPDALDTVSVLFEFENRVSGVLCNVRSTPFFWRVHVFGSRGSAEALGENNLVLRMTGAMPRSLNLEPVGALRFELEAFADALAGRSPYPIPTTQILDTVAAFEAIVKSMQTNGPVPVGNEQGIVGVESA
jgi:predicted dehydrogenase